MLTYLYTAILVILISVIQQSYAIHCYVCNSARDPRCGDPFDPTTIEKADCDQLKPDVNSTICRKNIQKVNLGSRTDLRVVRACGHIPNKKFEDDDPDQDDKTRCFTRAGTFEVMVTYCSCGKDHCNSGERLDSLKPLLLLIWLIPLAVVENLIM